MRGFSFLLFFVFIVVFTSCFKTKNKVIAAPGQTFMNVPYTTVPDWNGVQKTLTLDVYLPAGAKAGDHYPLMLMIHGGGFNEGDKKDMAAHCSVAADSGYVGISMNYRLGWQRGTNACEGDTLSQYEALYRAVQDANMALHFLIINAGEYHIDTSRIFIGGGSAGSVVALYTSYLRDDLVRQQFPGMYNKLGALQADGNTFSIKGILNLWGGMGDTTLINRYNAIPMISFHGTSDLSSPADTGHEFSCAAFPKAYGSAFLTRQLARYGAPYQLHLKKGAAHAPAAYKAPFVMPLAIRFFNGIVKGAPQASNTWVE